MTLIDEVARHGAPEPFWTLGGGTVLMLRYRHRRSRDIDIFVPDPQSLGFVSPRLSPVAESIAHEYVEGPGFVKLIRDEGEIDVVAAPNLTAKPFEVWRIEGRAVRVETAVVRHRAEFLAQLRDREDVLRAQFDAIDALDYRPTFGAAAERARRFLLRLRGRSRSHAR